jgi:hypothetical protein
MYQAPASRLFFGIGSCEPQRTTVQPEGDDMRNGRHGGLSWLRLFVLSALGVTALAALLAASVRT